MTKYRDVAENLRAIPLAQYPDIPVIDDTIESALVAAFNDGVEAGALLTDARTLHGVSEKIRALKLPEGGKL